VKRFLTFCIIALAALLTSCTPVTDRLSKVVRIIDGDTIEIAGGIRVRYIGIDAPEVYPREEAYGREASAANRELVGGRVVRLEKDVSETDRYGRLLRYVHVDGILVNGEMVRRGWARSAAYPPDTRYQRILDDLENEAREGSRGMWQYAE
jgi:micrococcal nuclease